MYKFHSVCGPLVRFSNEFRTAERIRATTDFDGGLVFSDRRLETNTIFQVHIDKKVGLWSGGLEIGVTCMDPGSLSRDTVPKSATEMRNGTWLMTSTTILHDGQPVLEDYGCDLENLEAGSTVGLMRTRQGALVFFIQGVSQGTAVPYIPADVYCVVSLYGKCSLVSIMETTSTDQSTNTVERAVHKESVISDNNAEQDKLRFHQNFGPLVKLSNNQRTAERRRPLEEFNNAIVLTHRPLREEELFQVRIDKIIHKWSGSIEFGLITHSPDSFSGTLDFPATLTVFGNGTVIMSGSGVLHDGKATNSPYSNFNLDQLQEGDRVGVMRKATGDVVFFVNGENQGVATCLPTRGPVWGTANLYGMAAKITIVDRDEREEHNLRVTNRNTHDLTMPKSTSSIAGDSPGNELLFHPSCGFHAAVINNGRTAHRPEAVNDFNHGVVLTNRILQANEMFEVRLDKIVTKWAGSIEIGVTTHPPNMLEYPCTMTNLRSGYSVMMTGNGIMLNGHPIIETYGHSLDRLKIGDRIGVLRKENGNLHFFVNSVDQGCAAHNVSSAVYGVIDLYGQAAQATIVSYSSVGSDRNFTSDNIGDQRVESKQVCRALSHEILHCGELRFHNLHGKNARVSNNGLTASRPNASTEFNAAIVVSSRALKDNELFEVVIERMVDRWSGNIEAGVTTVRPENLIFPNTMTDLADSGTIMLSGSSIMSGGNTITNRYGCNLDCLTVGSRVGMMRKSDGTLWFFINGEVVGPAPVDVPPTVYAVIDLYGQCAQVSITRIGDISLMSSQVVDSLSMPFNDTSHRFSLCCGKNVVLKNNNLTATRIRHYNHALIFSSAALDFDELFEVRITEVNPKWAGTLMIGVTSLNIGDDSASHIPLELGAICADTWYLKDCAVYKNQQLLKDNYCVDLNRLCIGDRIGLKISPEKFLKFFINGEELGVAACGVPKGLNVVIDLFGSCESVLITSTVRASAAVSTEGVNLGVIEPHHTMAEASYQDAGPSTGSGSSKRSDSHEGFSPKHSRNIELLNGGITARRTTGYQGFVFSNQVLHKGRLFEVRLDKVNNTYTGSLMVGVLECNPDRIQFPFNALGFKKACWLVMGDDVFRNGMRTGDKIGTNLNTIQVGNTVGLLVDSSHNLHLIANDIDSVIAREVGSKCRALIVLYGVVDEVTIIQKDDEKYTTKYDPSEKEVAWSSSVMFRSLETCSKKCDYMEACERFKSSLFLPDVFFVQSEPVQCFCSTCYVGREEENMRCKQGDPPAEFWKPLGFVRFPVNLVLENLSTSSSGQPNSAMTASANSLSNVLTTWHVAYYGLEILFVREVMDCGHLLPPDSFVTYDTEKEEKLDDTELIFSPSVEYAIIPEFCPQHIYTDPQTRKQVEAKVAFQVLLQPGSYKVGSPTYPVPSSVWNTLGVELDSIQWSTKEQGSTHVSALLIKLDGYNMS